MCSHADEMPEIREFGRLAGLAIRLRRVNADWNPYEYMVGLAVSLRIGALEKGVFSACGPFKSH